jgi:hypothetical protein
MMTPVDDKMISPQVALSRVGASIRPTSTATQFVAPVGARTSALNAFLRDALLTEPERTAAGAAAQPHGPSRPRSDYVVSRRKQVQDASPRLEVYDKR